MASLPPPTAAPLAIPDGASARMMRAFADTWGLPAAVVARAPGRVNLIGEHIDYEGYGVLPMALKQACCVAAAWRPGSSGDTAGRSVHAANTSAPQYPSASLPLVGAGDVDVGLPAGTPAWLTYVRAALKGCGEFAAAKQASISRRHPASAGDILLLVDSSVPPAAGLSSSSALVVATALALLALWELPASPAEVADLTCRCERFVGTQGGGMDQAVSLLAQAGVALHVEFDPVRAQPVQLPAGATFVVANSLAPSAKAETASTRFNLRVLECRLAAMLLAQQAASDWRQVSILKQVEPQLLQLGATHGLEAAQEQLSAAVRQLLPQQSYQLDEVAAALGVPRQRLLDLLPPALQAAAAQASQLQLQQRALHVYAEAHRVLQFAAVCGDAALTNEAKLQQLGELLNASHASCAGLYQCSCDELDALVGAARAAGALGARLTGAGWGGCTVSLVREQDAPRFIAQLRESYFMPLVASGMVREEELAECLFASKPSSGAAVMQLSLAPAGEEAQQAAAAAAAEPAAV